MAEFHERELLELSGGTDVHGVSTLTLPLMAKNVAEAYTIGPRVVLGLPLQSRSFQRGEGGLIVVNLIYAGEAEGNDSSGNEAGAIGRITYALRPKWGEEPVETHPFIREIMKRYAGTWKDGRVIFPPEYKPGATSTGLGGGNSSVAMRNPMFGTEKWRPIEVTWHREYAAKEVPGDILSRIGKVISNPPGDPPTLPGRTKWLVEPPEVDDSDSGNVKRISEAYTLLPEDAPELFYKPA